MKLFRVSCFVKDQHLHDLMSFLEDIRARNVEVVSVRGKRVTEVKSSKPKTEKGTALKQLYALAGSKGGISREDLRKAGFNLQWMGGLIRYGYARRVGDYYHVKSPKKASKKARKSTKKVEEKIAA